MDIVIPPNVLSDLNLPETQGSPPLEPREGESPEVKEPGEKKEEVKEPTAAEVKEVKRLLKLKIDGKEQELPEDEVIRLAALGQGAHKRFEEASAMRKQAESFIAALKANPAAVLSDPRLGLDFKKIAEDFIWEDIQEKTLTPEQKARRDLERENQKYKDAEAKQKAEADAKEAATLREHYEKEYNDKIMSALDRGGVPKTKGTVRRMAYYLQQALANNIDLQPADLVAQVRKDYMDEHQEMYGSADGDTLVSLVGEGLAKKIRDADLKRLKSTQPEAHQRQTRVSSPKEKPVKKLSGSEWREDLERRMFGGK